MAKPDMTSEAFRSRGLQIRSRSNAVTDYKAELLTQIKDAGLPEPEREYVFHDKRKWRMDFAYIEQKVGIEYQGGIFDNSPSHSSVSGILRDYEKTTEAQLNGWIVLLVTPQSVANGTALRYVKRAMNLRANCVSIGGNQAAKDAARTLRSVADKLESA